MLGDVWGRGSDGDVQADDQPARQPAGFRLLAGDELEESTISTFGGNPSPSGGYDYIWFNGHPIAEENGGTHWTFTDHLGTPILETDGSGNVAWRPEYEPYGRVWALRTADQHEA